MNQLKFVYNTDLADNVCLYFPIIEEFGDSDDNNDNDHILRRQPTRQQQFHRRGQINNQDDQSDSDLDSDYNDNMKKKKKKKKTTTKKTKKTTKKKNEKNKRKRDTSSTDSPGQFNVTVSTALPFSVLPTATRNTRRRKIKDTSRFDGLSGTVTVTVGGETMQFTPALVANKAPTTRSNKKKVHLFQDKDIYPEDDFRISNKQLLKGLKFVFTGGINGDVDELERVTKDLGGKLQQVVNGETNYLICGGKLTKSYYPKRRLLHYREGKKYKKAVRMNTLVILEGKKKLYGLFRKYINNSSNIDQDNIDVEEFPLICEVQSDDNDLTKSIFFDVDEVETKPKLSPQYSFDYDLDGYFDGNDCEFEDDATIDQLIPYIYVNEYDIEKGQVKPYVSYAYSFLLIHNSTKI